MICVCYTLHKSNNKLEKSFVLFHYLQVFSESFYRHCASLRKWFFSFLHVVFQFYGFRFHLIAHNQSMNFRLVNTNLMTILFFILVSKQLHAVCIGLVQFLLLCNTELGRFTERPVLITLFFLSHTPNLSLFLPHTFSASTNRENFFLMFSFVQSTPLNSTFT